MVEGGLKMKHIQKLRKLILTLGILAGMSLTAYAAGGGTEVTQANVICQQYSYFDAGNYSSGTLHYTPPADITNIELADAQAFGAAVNCPTTYWVVVYAKDGDNLKWTSNGKTGEQTSTPKSANNGRVLSAWSMLYNDDVYHFGGNYDPDQCVTFYFSKGLATVSVTGVSLNKNSATLAVGGTETLTATVSPDGATNKTVTWSSDNTSVATVDANGKVTAASAGTATITVTATNGTNDTSDDKQATCTVTVTAEQPVTVAAKADPSTTGTYYATFYDSTTSYTANCEVYYATAKADGRLTLQKAEGNVIKAGEGVILKATSETVTLTKTTTEANYDSLLTGSNSETTVENALVLSHGKNGVWFYKYSGTLGANKAYLAQ